MRMRLFAAGALLPALPALAQLDETTSFEGITSSEFTIGTAPISAIFTGGMSGEAPAGLVRTGTFSWRVFDDSSGQVAFRAPAEIVDLWAIDSAAAHGGMIRVIGLSGETLATIEPGLAFENHRFEGLGPIQRLELVNTGAGAGESTAVDDFGFRAVRALEDPIPARIATGEVRINLQLVADGLTAPNGLMVAPGDTERLFVVDQPGQIWIIKDGVLLAEPFLDVSDQIIGLGIFGTGDPFGDFDERGLLGLAFHPDYNTPGAPGFGRLYTYYSVPVDGPADFTTADPPPPGREFNHQSVIVEWQVDAGNPDRVDTGSQRELMRVDQPQFNHNAGEIRFGPDGMLYIAFGDGGGADDEDGIPSLGGITFGHGPGGNGQNLETVLGSLLRIDPLGLTGATSANGAYSIPADNPFVGRRAIDEIWAYGFRNPFRFSFDAAGRLIVGDVGQNDIEEVVIVEAGDNHGWRLKEGSFRFVPNGTGRGFVIENFDGLPPDLVDPVLEYDHDEGLSVIAGFIYRGSALPDLEGKYIFGDFSTSFGDPLGRLFYGDFDTGEILEFPNSAAGLGLYIKGFGEDHDGEVYVLAGPNSAPFGDFGAVYKIVNACEADCDGSGALDFFDFLCFQDLFAAGDPGADCDGSGAIDPADFLCFQELFAAGCP